MSLTFDFNGLKPIGKVVVVAGMIGVLVIIYCIIKDLKKENKEGVEDEKVSN